MLALVIDTSSAAVTASVVDFGSAATGRSGDPVVLAARTTIDARAHAELLAPSIAAGLDEAGLTPADLGAVVAGVGPGPFTGLRVGLVTALAIADALSLPAYGVCSLDAIAAEVASQVSGHAAGRAGQVAGSVAGGGVVLVAGDARRREVYWARYSTGFPATGVRLAGPDVNRPADLDLAGDLDRPGVAVMAGAGARLYADVFARPLLDVDYPTPLGLARLAADRVRDGAPGEPLTPLYLRRPDAVAAASFKPVTR